MTNWNLLSDEEFARAATDFVERACPPELRHLPHRPRWEKSAGWYQAMSREGWLAPGWPVEFGGMGLEPSRHLIYLEIFERLGTPAVAPQGIVNVGPALIGFGTDEQRQEFLPKILSGEHRWCQGFSEPNAGSDLASVRTEARPDGDGYIINGQKIWSTGAIDANWMYALVRTDKSVRKQAGLSFIMFPMDQPGVTVRPIRTISGGEEFCEVFLDHVRASAAHMVGGLNNGWKVANGLLGFERLWSGSAHQCRQALVRLKQVAHAAGKLQDPAFLRQITRLELDVLDLASCYTRSTRNLQVTRRVGFEASMLKIWATETCQRIGELMMEVGGDAVLVQDGTDFDGRHLDALTPFLEARAPTIYGGTVQIHRNILSKNVLNLPN
ncbi:acyl-CoA dehydrogenase family protein [Paraburkholderia ferrariae]|jgi:alkylation response protein AidB-like acyl-CoA dehydrogenase|uniref:acyl-CoA dehydrogenase family protein n=1 Tax=Paraburkholderia ferrariae TaxID=386056 RepID=UPI00047F24CC|nr:acyl-CoA dehydrogenase family protein [Paraburkholderia ferrariae]